MLSLLLHQLPIEVVPFISEPENFCLPLWKQTTTPSWRNNNPMFNSATFLPNLRQGRYKCKNGRISEISEKFSSLIWCAELPQFDATFGENWLQIPVKSRHRAWPNRAMTVRGLDVTIAVQDAIVAVQDKYARMLVLQGHCPLVRPSALWVWVARLSAHH